MSEANDVNALVMFDLQEANKKLILHAAYFAVKQDEWKRRVFKSGIDSETKKELIGKIPCGDPLNNLLTLASRLMSDFDEHAPIKDEIEKIRAFVYGT